MRRNDYSRRNRKKLRLLILKNFLHFRLYKKEHFLILMSDLKGNLGGFEKQTALKVVINWVKKAQYTHGGFSAGYSFAKGWLPSYPETTGYLIPSLFSLGKFLSDLECCKMAHKAAMWLQIIQNKEGWYPSKYYSSDISLKPSVFNTAQIAQGLLSAYKAAKDESFLYSACKAAKWIIAQQEPDGFWCRWAYNNIPHTYYSRVSWILVEIGIVTENPLLIRAANKNLDWVLSQQLENGWFRNNGFLDHLKPLTHTIAYTMEGILEAGILLNRIDLVESAQKAADSLLQIFKRENWLKGTYDQFLNSQDNWSCITGNAQIALVWLRLYEIINNREYLKAAKSLNNWLCSTQVRVNGREFPPGGLKGSHPVWGQYDPFSMPLHAAKFFIDTLLLEMTIDKNSKN